MGKLTAASEDFKTRKRKEKEERKKNAKRIEEDDGKRCSKKNGVDDDTESGDASGDREENKGRKKKRFHPFGWGKKDKKKRKAGEGCGEVGGAQGRNATTQQRV